MINTQIQLGVNSTDSLFIEEMTIVPQVRIIPEMHNESIIVKMKMKGDFKGFDKLDCTIKTKFYFYTQYLGNYY